MRYQTSLWARYELDNGPRIWIPPNDPETFLLDPAARFQICSFLDQACPGALTITHPNRSVGVRVNEGIFRSERPDQGKVEAQGTGEEMAVNANELGAHRGKCPSTFAKASDS
jgi:hypothetical protein